MDAIEWKWNPSMRYSLTHLQSWWSPWKTTCKDLLNNNGITDLVCYLQWRSVEEGIPLQVGQKETNDVIFTILEHASAPTFVMPSLPCLQKTQVNKRSLTRKIIFDICRPKRSNAGAYALSSSRRSLLN
jgi:hypothetical protein